MLSQKLGCISLDACKSQQILNLTLKDHSSENSMRYLTNDLFFKEHDRVIHQPVFNSGPSLVAFLINYHNFSIISPHL